MTNILIIHDSKSSLMLIKSYIMSELSDAMISEATSVPEGEKIMNAKKLDVYNMWKADYR